MYLQIIFLTYIIICHQNIINTLGVQKPIRMGKIRGTNMALVTRTEDEVMHALQG